MKEAFRTVTGDELLKLAKQHVSDLKLQQAISEESFRDFARIAIFMSFGSALSLLPGAFAHSFLMKGKDDSYTEVNFTVQITAKKIEQRND